MLMEGGEEEEEEEEEDHSMLFAALALAMLGPSRAADDLNMTATGATNVVGAVGESVELTYNISTRVGVIVQCTRNTDVITSFYVLGRARNSSRPSPSTPTPRMLMEGGEEEEEEEEHSMLFVALALAILGPSRAADDLNMTATGATNVVGEVGESVELTYNISTRVGVIVQCTRNTDVITSFYVLVRCMRQCKVRRGPFRGSEWNEQRRGRAERPRFGQALPSPDNQEVGVGVLQVPGGGGEAVRLERSLRVGPLKYRDAGVYSCSGRVPVPGGGEPALSGVSWSLDVGPRRPPCLEDERCVEAEGHSCGRDLCACPTPDTSFFSKGGVRRCRLTRALSLTARIAAPARPPRSASELLEISYYLVTYGGTVVAWSSERVRHHAVAKVLVEGPRRQFSSVIRLRRHEYARGGSVNVTATLSGTPVSKEVQVDVPSTAFQVGDNCTADSDCRDADGFCLRGRCSCTDGTGKEHGRPLDGHCLLPCSEPRDCAPIQHSLCLAGVCRCSRGLHLDNRSCVPDQCADHVPCGANETCVGGHCFCRPGFVLEAGGRCAQAECLTSAHCVWDHTECWDGKCICRPGYREIEGECGQEYFGSCKSGCDSVPNSVCANGIMCACERGHVYRSVGGVRTCAPVECRPPGMPCPGGGRCGADFSCVCGPAGNDSATCTGEDVALVSLAAEDGAAAPYQSALLLCGGALACAGLSALPLLLLKAYYAAARRRRRQARGPYAGPPYWLAWLPQQQAPPTLLAPSQGQQPVRAAKRRYPFEGQGP
ncbi:uncharacterized protein LOC144142949 [Haemaphysalis longicornis]